MERHLSPNRAASPNGHSPTPRLTIRADQTMDPFMSTPQFPQLPTVGLIPSNLAIQASAPDAEPCDIAESAMPDLVFGDLAPADEAWVRDHTITCNYCANILDSLEQVCASLDKCEETVADAAATRRPPTTFCLGIPEARYGFMETPVGDVLVAASDRGVVEVSYLANHSRPESLRDLERRDYLVYERQDAVHPVIDQLGEYFSHRRSDFEVPVDFGGVTDFTRSVLDATYRIPYGKVRTYGDIAGEIGKPKASRAVGNALGRNPIPVIVPCHRVVLASGAMGWYTGGPEIKRTLLGIEGVKFADLAPPVQPVLGLEI